MEIPPSLSLGLKASQVISIPPLASTINSNRFFFFFFLVYLMFSKHRITKGMVQAFKW